MRQEAHRSIRIPPRRSTVATSLQPSLSASSAVWRLASTMTTQLALMQSAHSTIIYSRRTYCLRLHAYRRMHLQKQLSTRPIYPPGLEAGVRSRY